MALCCAHSAHSLVSCFVFETKKGNLKVLKSNLNLVTLIKQLSGVPGNPTHLEVTDNAGYSYR